MSESFIVDDLTGPPPTQLAMDAQRSWMEQRAAAPGQASKLTVWICLCGPFYRGEGPGTVWEEKPSDIDCHEMGACGWATVDFNMEGHATADWGLNE